MKKYHVKILTLSPLHIGSGRELLLDFDYIVERDRTFRLNIDQIFSDFYHPDLQTQIPGVMIQRNNQRQKKYFRYEIPGSPETRKTGGVLRECIKDVFDQPYIPGSSIKGAIRTALAVNRLNRGEASFYKDITSSKGRYADDTIEKKIFGDSPNQDWMRALHISDAVLSASEEPKDALMGVYRTSPYSINDKENQLIPIAIEGIQRKTQFEAILTIDDELLGNSRQFPTYRSDLHNLIPAVQSYSLHRLELLKVWFSPLQNASKVSKLINAFLELSKKYAECNSALLQIGFGSGWDGITYGEVLKSDPQAFEHILKTYNLLRRRRNLPSVKRKAGDPFPTSRKVIFEYNVPISLLGWCFLIFEEI